MATEQAPGGAAASNAAGGPQEPQEQGQGSRRRQGARGSQPEGTESPGAGNPDAGGTAAEVRRNVGVMLTALIPLFNTWLAARPATIEVEGAVVTVTRIDPDRLTLHGQRANQPFEVEQLQP